MPFNQHSLISRIGNEDGARQEFARLVAAFAELQSPGVRRIRENPGDWGIDAFVGQLDAEVSVWQAKFFIDQISNTQKSQIRDSFKSAREAATKNGYRLAAWTLCIPIDMDGPETQWWDRWKRKQEREHGVTISLWDKTKLDQLLRSPDAAEIDAEFFPPHTKSRPAALPVQPLPAGTTYDHMLFIKQLRAAQIIELDAAREEFFNAELLTREVQDKAVPEHVLRLGTVRSEVRSLWSLEYNGACSANPDSDLLPELHPKVMRSIRDYHNAQPDPPLRMSVVHRLGTMHQVVEGGDAGWVRNFRALAEGHRA
jgi:hypothetical protein